MLDGFARYDIYLTIVWFPSESLNLMEKNRNCLDNPGWEGESDKWWGALHFWRFCDRGSFQKLQVLYHLSNQSKWGLAEPEELLGRHCLFSPPPQVQVPSVRRGPIQFCPHTPSPRAETPCYHTHDAETSMNSFRCLAGFAFYKALEKNRRKQLPIREHHCSSFHHEGNWGSRTSGSSPKAAQESWSELIMRLLGRRKVTGRTCPGSSGVPTPQASPLLEGQILMKGGTLGALASPQSYLLDMEECFLIPI